MSNSMVKGDSGISKVMARLIEEDWTISIPINQRKLYDLIAEKDGVCRRIQVKYKSQRNGVISPKVRYPSRSHRYNDFDTLAVYCPDTKQIYFVDRKELGKNEVNLRLSPPIKKNKTIKYASKYKRF